MAYQGVPGWIRRRKLTTGKYEILHNGEPVAVAVLTGRYNVDDYPWDWYTTDDAYGIHAGRGDTLNSCIEQLYWKVMKPVEDARVAVPTEVHERESVLDAMQRTAVSDHPFVADGSGDRCAHRYGHLPCGVARQLHAPEEPEVDLVQEIGKFWSEWTDDAAPLHQSTYDTAAKDFLRRYDVTRKAG